jgi:deoxyribose-phosphate aldolase
MTLETILSKVDHTLLAPDANINRFFVLCEEAIKYNVASVCVPPSRIALCRRELNDRIPVCTVVGFPNGYNDTEIKLLETKEAILDGAKEIDVVVNIGDIKDCNYGRIHTELDKIREAAHTCILKVIIETALLTDKEKIKMCGIVKLAGADFIKTSTGFNGHGATPEDVALLVKHSHPEVKVKASGGINTLEDAQKFIELGADRLGTSKIIKLIKQQNGTAGY